MKKILGIYSALVVCLFTSIQVKAQLYGNEWINYNATYYKIKVGSTGIKRVNISTLQSAGLPTNVTGNQLKMIRNGIEVPISVSNSGTLSGTDFIQFYGKKNDGIIDTAVYVNQAAQTNPHISLFADTSIYFLTYTATTNNVRITTANNTIPTNPGAPTASAMTTVLQNFTNYHFYGKTEYADGVFYYNSSTFTKGEGYVDGIHSMNSNYTIPINTPNAVTTGGQSTMEVTVGSQSLLDNITAKVAVNGSAMDSSAVNKNEFGRYTFSFPSTNLTATTNLTIYASSTGPNAINYFGCSYYRLTYPRNFDMANASNYTFTLPAKGSATYLEFTNFNNSNVAPILYDLTNNNAYLGDISVAGVVRYNIGALATSSNFYLSAISDIQTIAQASATNFVNYANSTTNKGNYIIITQNKILGTHNGRNIINEYASYRASVKGGSYQPIVVDIDQLYDQFAYGVEFHPTSIRNFIRYANNQWSTNPGNVLLIGKGLLYTQLDEYRASTHNLPIVPTWGDPGSDNMFVILTPNRKMSMPIGRISVRDAAEVANYFDKMVAYENAILDTTGTPDAQLWKKRVLGISGGIEASQQRYIFLPALNNVKSIIEPSNMGALMTVAGKNNIEKVTDITSNTIDSLISVGVQSIAYFGHGGTSGFEYSLRSPTNNFSNLPKVPVLLAMACDLGRIFDANTNQGYTEKYVLQPSGGTSAFIASTNITYTNFHPNFMNSFYGSLANQNYGARLGKHMQTACDTFMTLYPTSNPSSDYFFAHTTSHILQGDPALLMANAPKPDFQIDSNAITISPSLINISQDSIHFKYISYNLGKGIIGDSVKCKVEWISPNNAIKVLKTYRIKSLNSTDTATTSLAIDKLLMPGLNKIRITLDADSLYAEVNENNNVGEKTFFVHAEQLIPVMPKEYSIVYQQGVTLKASTLNPMQGTANYRMEIDTTMAFNSPLKLQTSVTSKGGVLTWTPPITMTDSVVYYWRATRDSIINGATNWASSSFIFLQNGSAGWNQSHYFQYLDNSYKTLYLDSPSRDFIYGKTWGNVRLLNAINNLPPPLTYYGANEIRTIINGIDRSRYHCGNDGYVHIMLMVVDTNSMIPWANTLTGLYGAYGTCSSNTRNSNSFEYSLGTKAGRDAARAFLNMAPTGSFIIVRSADHYNNAFVPASTWANDTLVNGSGQSLYHDLLNLGFNQIDSYNIRRSFYFTTMKGISSNTFPTLQLFTPGIGETIDYTFDATYADKSGSMASENIGPFSSWTNLKWANYPNAANDTINKSHVKIYGVVPGQNDVLLATNYGGDTSLSFINPATYTNIRLEWSTTDSILRTAPKLKYWRVIGTPMPEAALAPNLHLSIMDTVLTNQNFSMAVQNLTPLGMDSMLVNYMIVNDANQYTQLISKKYRPLPGSDTIHIDLSFTPPTTFGNYYLYVDANPFANQPEQYHPNNIGYVPFVVGLGHTTPIDAINGFNLTSNGNCGVIVSWFITGNDNDINRYEVQRSKDGKAFETIYTAKAGKTTYQYNDAELARSAFYYRIVEVKNSGIQEFTSVKSYVNNCQKGRMFEVFPNPVKKDVQLHLDMISEHVQVYIVNVLGQKILDQTYSGKAGSRFSKTFNLSHVANGAYMLYVIDGTDVKSVKLIKD